MSGRYQCDSLGWNSSIWPRKPKTSSWSAAGTASAASAPIVSASGWTPGGSHSATPPQSAIEPAVPVENARPPNASTSGGQYVRYVLASRKTQRTIGSLLKAIVIVAIARSAWVVDATSSCDWVVMVASDRGPDTSRGLREDQRSVCQIAGYPVAPTRTTTAGIGTRGRCSFEAEAAAAWSSGRTIALDEKQEWRG